MACTYTPGTYTNDPCPFLFGRIAAMAFLKTDSVITDYTLEAEWSTELGAGRLFLVPETSGEYTSGTPTTKEGRGVQVERVTGRVHTLTFDVGNFDQNLTFWTEMSKSNDLYVIMMTQDKQGFGHVTNKISVTIKPEAVIEKPLDGERFFNVVVTWQEYDLPEAVGTVPDTVFDGTLV